MEIANVLLALSGDKGNTVPKYGVTAAEVAVMRLVHGDDAVFDIDITGTVQRTHRQEIARLTELYGRQEGEKRVSPAVQQLYPGAAARVFEAFDELEIPDELYIAERRRTKRGAVAPSAGEAGDEAVKLGDMTVNQLRAHADKLGVDLAGITKKADIIEAIETHQAAAQDVQEDDGDDGVGEMDDEFSEKENLFN